MFAPCYQHHLFGLHDRVYTHRDSADRHLVHRTEHDFGVLFGVVVQQDQSSDRVERRARLVEGDITAASYTQQLEVDTAGFGYEALVVVAEGHDILLAQVPRDGMDILRQYIHMVQQLGFELRMVAQAVIGERVVLVEVEEDHIAETESLFAVLAYQFGIDISRRTAGCQRDYVGLELLLTQPDLGGYILRHSQRAKTRGFIDSDR